MPEHPDCPLGQWRKKDDQASKAVRVSPYVWAVLGSACLGPGITGQEPRDRGSKTSGEKTTTRRGAMVL